MSEASNGWRACIDHIIRPDSPCPVCEIEKLTDEIEQLQKVKKAADDLFHWHNMVEGGIVPYEAWTPLGNALFPGGSLPTKESGK